jgi:hypothetical protein
MPYDFKWLKDTIGDCVAAATGALVPVVLVIAIDFGSYILLKNEQDAIRNLSATNCNTNK